MLRIIITYVLLFTVSFFNMSASNLIPKIDGNASKFVVVLDAGHGGHDSGNRGNGYFEKDIALKIVLEIGAQLEKDKRFKVIYTRKTDTFVELYERGAIANRASADLFVSIHCNAHSSQAYGTETFVLGLHANARNFEVAKKENAAILLEDDYESNYDGFDPNSPESVIGLTLMQEEYLEQSLSLASLVQAKFTKSLKKNNRGVKQAGFIVLHKTFMPSVLIETGFLTNVNEGKYLNSKKGQQDMANAIFMSIVNYKETLETVFEQEALPVSSENKAQKPKTPRKSIRSPKAKKSAQTTNKKGKEKKENATDFGKGHIEFKVQIASSSHALELIPKNFKGLQAVTSKKIGKAYKYFYGSSGSYKAIQVQRQEAKKRGFKSCFIVAFKDGQKIAIAKAIEATAISNENK